MAAHPDRPSLPGAEGGEDTLVPASGASRRAVSGDDLAATSLRAPEPPLRLLYRRHTMAQMLAVASLAARAAPPPRLASPAPVAPHLASCAARAPRAAASRRRLTCCAAAPRSTGGDSASSREVRSAAPRLASHPRLVTMWATHGLLARARPPVGSLTARLTRNSQNVKRLATLGEMQVLAALNAMPSSGENAGSEEVERVSSLQRSAEEARDVEERAWQAVEAQAKHKA